MKNLIFISLFLSCYFVLGQDKFFDTNFFKNSRINFNLNNSIELNSNSLEPYYINQIQEQSVLVLNPNEFINPYTVTTLKLKLKKIPEKIDYENLMMQCGPLQPRNSKEMMIHVLKNYAINKFINLFVPTSFTITEKHKIYN